ncbi:MAG: alkaline phosphatase [Clostridia bacterium]|nr:alkaline phosphatase [Clostridia bacterium]
MKHLRCFSLLLALLTLLSLAGCGPAESIPVGTTAPQTTAAPVTEVLPAIKTVAADGKSDYVIVRGDMASEREVDLAIKLRGAIVEATGAEIGLTTDWVKRGTEVPADGLEIAVGNTNRPQTVEARQTLLREQDWAILCTGDRIVITGGSDNATAAAVEAFIADHVDAKTGTVTIEEGYRRIYAHPYPIGNVSLDGTPLREFIIVTPAKPSPYETAAALALNDFLQTLGGFTLPVADDSAAPAAHELLIGATSRDVSRKYDALTYGEMEYLLTAEKGAVVLRGADYRLGAAIGALGALIRQVPSGQDGDIRLPADGKPTTFTFPRKAENAILLIGDGMGREQINLALANGMEIFTPRLFPHQGEAKTYSASSSVTDSAASGTALSSGYKTKNGYIGMTPKAESKPNIREIAASKGALTAVITTDSLTGATPAAFTAHVKDRDLTAAIAAQQEALTDIHYLAGKMGDKLVIESRAALRTVVGDGSGSFFVMIEEAYVDKHAHSNAGDDVVRCVKLLNDTATYLSQFVFLHPDTVLIVTADHECGGIKQKADGTFVFTSTKHTGVNVPVSAIGPGTEAFHEQTVNNIDIAKFMGRIWGEENLGG